MNDEKRFKIYLAYCEARDNPNTSKGDLKKATDAYLYALAMSGFDIRGK